VDVQNPLRIGLKHLGAEDAHESGEADEIRAVRPQRRHERAVVLLAARVLFVTQKERLKTRGARALQTRGIRSIRNDDADRGVEAAGADRVDDRLKVGASPGNQNAEAPTLTR